MEVCSNDYWGEGKNENVGMKKGRKRHADYNIFLK